MTAYPVAAEAMDLEIYVLAALLCGSSSLREAGSDHRRLRSVRSTFELSEVSRRLISLAVLLRSHLDSTATRSDDAVGFLFRDFAQERKEEALNLREACHKIIHADEIDFSPEHEQDDDQDADWPALSRQISLRGELRGTAWRADVDLLRFLNAACKHS